MHTLEEFLLQLSLCNFNFDGLVHLLCVSALVVGVIFDGCGEESVDEGCLSESRFASNHNSKSSSSFSYDLMSLVWLQRLSVMELNLGAWC